MFIDWLLEIFKANAGADAIVWRDQASSYGRLLERVGHWRRFIQDQSIAPGTVVAVEADFSPESVALLLALVERGCVFVPLTAAVAAKKAEFLAVAQVEAVFSLAGAQPQFARESRRADHPLYQQLRALNRPGLVLFSSGSTGKSKAALHDMTLILEKFKVQRHSVRSISFLLYDHIGGINTLLYVLSNAGCVIAPTDRNPDSVLSLIAKHRAQLLPTSPTFLNLILLSEAFKRHDLSSLQTITYGTEPMPQSTLERIHQVLPQVTLQQTYGLSEIGIMRSKSKSSDSLWVKVGGEGFETRIVDGVLHVKARSAMLGYLNHPSPFSADGWFITGDMVEQDGEYIRILGRKSEVINVGGEKVHPAEVESIILEMPEVSDVTVHGEPNPITGQIVCARVTLRDPAADPREMVRAIKAHCRARAQAYKTPVRIVFTDQMQHADRFKRMRGDKQ